MAGAPDKPSNSGHISSLPSTKSKPITSKHSDHKLSEVSSKSGAMHGQMSVTHLTEEDTDDYSQLV